VGDYSWEDDGLQHGVFTKYLIAGLQGAARDGNGDLTASSVFDYVNQEVRTWALNNRVTQAPFQAGEWSGDFLLASRSEGTKVPAHGRLVITTSPQGALIRVDGVAFGAGTAFTDKSCPR
jgi:hypothetical protein